MTYKHTSCNCLACHHICPESDLSTLRLLLHDYVEVNSFECCSKVGCQCGHHPLNLHADVGAEWHDRCHNALRGSGAVQPCHQASDGHQCSGVAPAAAAAVPEAAAAAAIVYEAGSDGGSVEHGVPHHPGASSTS